MQQNPLEKDVERALTRSVGKAGGLCLKWVCPGWSGVPDRIILLPGGRIYFVELKRPKGGRISKLQTWWAEKLRALGFPHYFLFTHEAVAAFVHTELTGSRYRGYAFRVSMTDELEGEKNG